MASERKRGFTLVELVVVIVVIGILAGLVALGITMYQRQARDAVRQSGISTIVESLEKYYEKNGEYPSCAAMSKSAASVASELSIDQSSLKAPKSTADNSFICSALAASGDDQYAYVGDGSTACQTGAACLGWTIQYRNEETGEIVSVSSRHTANLATSGVLNLVASVVSDTQINLTWQSVPNTLSYRVEQSRNSNMSGATTTTTTLTSRSMTGLGAGTRYYFRVTPLQTSQMGAADMVNATTTIQAPTGSIVMATSLQSSNTIARGSASGAACPAGSTLQYAIGYDDRNTNVAVSISYGSWVTGAGASRDVAAAQGYNYTFQAKARCAGPDASSAEVVGTSANVTRPINAPAAPVYTGDPTMLAGYRYLHTFNTSCPAGTQLSGTVNLYHTGFSGTSRTPSTGYWVVPNTDWWYLGFAAGQVWEDLNYYALYQCKTDFTTSPDSATSSTYVTVECEPARRNYSASPRCDNYGQSPSSLPWGP